MVTKTNIPGGYKQTEVGVIPEDWEKISFAEAFTFLSTSSYSRAELSDDVETYLSHRGFIKATKIFSEFGVSHKDLQDFGIFPYNKIENKEDLDLVFGMKTEDDEDNFGYNCKEYMRICCLEFNENLILYRKSLIEESFISMPELELLVVLNAKYKNKAKQLKEEYEAERKPIIVKFIERKRKEEQKKLEMLEEIKEETKEDE